MVRASCSAGIDEVAAAITGFVNATIMARGRAVGPDDDFSTSGVDSMGLLKVLLFIETEFGLWIPDEDPGPAARLRRPFPWGKLHWAAPARTALTPPPVRRADAATPEALQAVV